MHLHVGGIKQDPNPNPKPYKLVRSLTGQSFTELSLYGIASILFPGFIDPSSVALCRDTDLQKWCVHTHTVTLTHNFKRMDKRSQTRSPVQRGSPFGKEA